MVNITKIKNWTCTLFLFIFVRRRTVYAISVHSCVYFLFTWNTKLNLIGYFLIINYYSLFTDFELIFILNCKIIFRSDFSLFYHCEKKSTTLLLLNNCFCLDLIYNYKKYNLKQYKIK